MGFLRGAWLGMGANEDEAELPTEETVPRFFQRPAFRIYLETHELLSSNWPIFPGARDEAEQKARGKLFQLLGLGL